MGGTRPILAQLVQKWRGNPVGKTHPDMIGSEIAGKGALYFLHSPSPLS